MFEIDQERPHQASSFYFLRNKEVTCYRVANYPDPKEEGFVAHYEALDKDSESTFLEDQSKAGVPFNVKTKSILIETYLSKEGHRTTKVFTDWYSFTHVVPKKKDTPPYDKPTMSFKVHRPSASSDDLMKLYALNNALVQHPEGDPLEFEDAQEETEFSVEFVQAWKPEENPSVRLTITRMQADGVARNVKYTEPE